MCYDGCGKFLLIICFSLISFLAAMPDHTIQFQHLIEEIPSVFFVYDLTSQRVTYVNAAYEQVLQGTCTQVNEELSA